MSRNEQAYLDMAREVLETGNVKGDRTVRVHAQYLAVNCILIWQKGFHC